MAKLKPITDKDLVEAGERFGPPWAAAIYLVRQTRVVKERGVLEEFTEFVGNSDGLELHIYWHRLRLRLQKTPARMFSRRDRALVAVALSLATGERVDLRDLAPDVGRADVAHIAEALNLAGHR